MKKNENIICIEEESLKSFLEVADNSLLLAHKYLAKIDESLEVQKNIKATLKKEGKSKKADDLYFLYNTMVDLSIELGSLRGLLRFFKYQEIENIEVTELLINHEIESELGDSSISLIKH